MKPSHRLLYCLSYLALYTFGSGIAIAQLTVTSSASPSAVGYPITISVGGCGPKTAHINFYIGTSSSHLYKTSPVATKVLKPAGGYATYSWHPTQKGTYYLGATTQQRASCGTKPAPAMTQVIAVAPAFFGFWSSAGRGGPDETSAVSGIANTSWLSCTSPSDCGTRLREARSYNMHAVVELDFAGLRPPAPGSSPAVVQTWLNSWRSTWQSYTSVFALYVANGTIAAFSPFDEPLGGEWSSGNHESDITSDLNSVAAIIKGTFPSTKVAMVLTGANSFTYLIHGQNVIPSDFDWIGIDIYECWNRCQDTNKTISHPYSWYVQDLEANLHSGQRVILLPATAVYTPGTYAQFEANPPSNLGDYVTTVQNILDLAGMDSRVIGVFGFLYQTFYQNGPSNRQVWVGCSDPRMTRMLSVVTEFSKNVERR